jgi:hypothetical protein
MRSRYLLHFVFSLLALQVMWNSSAQTPKVPSFSEVVNPVGGTAGFAAMYESSSAWGDFNNDGLPDLIVTGVGQKTTLYKNNGDNTFTEVSNSFPKVQQGAVAWGDYDNDGNLDLFISGATDTENVTKLFRNRGTANNFDFQEVSTVSFQPVYTGGNNQTTRYLSLGDYNNDGFIDVLLTGQATIDGSTVRFFSLYKNLLGQGFELQNQIVNGGNFTQLNGGMAAWADYNNDGFEDIVFNGYANESPNCRTGIYSNNGDGTFSPLAVVLDGTIAGELAWCDYNNDGYQDFIVTGYSYDAGAAFSTLYKNKGDSTFTALLPATTNIAVAYQSSLAWGDVNNDGLSDLVLTGTIYSSANSIVYLNKGDDTFAEETALLSKNRAGAVSLVDFDNDGDLDAFVIGYQDGTGAIASLLKNNLADGISANQKPSAPTALQSAATQESVKLQWTRSTDDTTPSAAILYNVYIKKEGSSRQMMLLPANTENGFLKVNENLNALTTNFYVLKGLEVGNYTFGVQAIDNGKATSAFATAVFTVSATSIDKLDKENVNVFAENGTLVISLKNPGLSDISVYDLRGVKVWSEKGNMNDRIHVNNLHRGVYIVTIAQDNKHISKKVVL